MTALALTPATLDLTVVQGDSFAESLTFGQSGSALNLSTYTALAQVRAEKSATSTLLATMTVGTGSSMTWQVRAIISANTCATNFSSLNPGILIVEDSGPNGAPA